MRHPFEYPEEQKSPSWPLMRAGRGQLSVERGAFWGGLDLPECSSVDKTFGVHWFNHGLGLACNFCLGLSPSVLRQHGDKFVSRIPCVHHHASHWQVCWTAANTYKTCCLILHRRELKPRVGEVTYRVRLRSQTDSESWNHCAHWQCVWIVTTNTVDLSFCLIKVPSADSLPTCWTVTTVKPSPFESGL